MTARYWVLTSDQLITDMDPSLLPDGLRLTGEAPVLPAAGHWYSASSHWRLFEDDNAPEDLDGCRIALILGRRGREGARSVIIERRVLS